MGARKVDLRSDGALWAEVMTHLGDDAKEQAGALLVRARPAGDPAALIVERWRPVPPEFVIPSEHGLAWAGRFNLRVAEEAAEAGLGVVLVHRHGGRSFARLSPTDRSRGRDLLRFLRRRCPDEVHGLLVIAPAGVDGWVEGPSGKRARWREIRVPSPRLTVHPPRREPGAELADDDRQLLAFGRAGIRAIAATSVGIVGLSGGGSHVAQQLIHAGARALVLVDPEKVEASNLRRLVGAYRNDTDRTPKVDVFRRLARRVGRVHIAPVRSAFPSQKAIDKLRQVDVLIGCVDGWDVRADLNSFALEHRIPYIDIGAVITPGVDGSEVRVSGQIAVVLPGGPCLRCMGLVTDMRVELARRVRQGYVVGAAEPQVVSVNGTLASEAVTAALFLVSGGLVSARRRYLYPPGTLHEVTARRSPACVACRAAGYE